MRRRPLQIFALTLLAVGVLGAAGCGGSKNAATTTSTTTSTSTTTTTTATSTAADTTTSGTDTSAAAALGALASSGNCKSLSELGQAFASAFTGANGDVTKEAALLKQFADRTPGDIKPDFETLADDLTKIASALKGYNPTSGGVPDASVLAKLAALQTSINQQDLSNAEQHISTWAAANCHA